MTCTPGHDDRLVVIFSHHGVESLVHPRTRHAGPDGQPLLGGAEVLALLHRYPNVILWLNGHTHLNAVRPRRDPRDPARGFWEVTTSSIVDWPCQARFVEIVEAAGQLSVFCTMIDHDSPIGPESLAAGVRPRRAAPGARRQHAVCRDGFDPAGNACRSQRRAQGGGAVPARATGRTLGHRPRRSRTRAMGASDPIAARPRRRPPRPGARPRRRSGPLSTASARPGPR